MRLGLANACIALLVLSSCGGTSEGGTNADNAETSTDGIDICALLSDEEISAAIGSAPASEPTEPIADLTGCNWGSGLLIIQIRPSNTLITAPTETDCPSAEIGDESRSCPGRVKFLTNGIHTTIQTIEDLSEAQLIAVANMLAPKL